MNSIVKQSIKKEVKNGYLLQEVQAGTNAALSTAFQADQHLSTDWLDMPTPRRGTAFQGGLSEGMYVGVWREGE